MYVIKRVHTAMARDELPALLALLEDAVNNGASIGFLRPLDPCLGTNYWEEVFGAVDKGAKILVVAHLDGELVGSAQLDLCMKQNGSHRAEIQKVMVLAAHRRKGIAAALMRQLEREAAAATRSLLFLDTEQGSGAVRFYESLSWRRVGSIPDYALSADGIPTPNVIYYKQI